MSDPASTPDPSTPSSAYRSMLGDWRMISDILAGPKAVRAAKERYLPKYEEEGQVEYDRRVKTAPWRPEFADALRTLASKPFGRDVALDGAVSEEIKTFADDVDARGNNLTTFARETFYRGIADGLHCILVDFPTMQPGATIAAEKAAGARPYWVHVKALDLTALYTALVGGKEIVIHARIKECVAERDGFSEKLVERVRVFDLKDGKPIWQLWEKTPEANNAAPKYCVVDEGAITQDQIPLVLYFTGERIGDHEVKPPLADLAEMQIELYQALSRQDEILTFAGAPMLAANGFSPPKDGGTVSVGPKRVLFAPPGADGAATGWEFVQPDAANLAEIRAHVASIIEDMRRLGMQPLLETNPTASGATIEADKAHSAVQAWAVGLKDALEQAFVFTSKWLGQSETVEVQVDTDFDASPYAPAPLQTLDKARDRKDVSRKAYVGELRRRGVLGPNYDADEDDEALAMEQQGLDPNEEIDPVSGHPTDGDLRELFDPSVLADA